MNWDALGPAVAKETIAAIKQSLGEHVPPIVRRAVEQGFLFGADNLILEHAPGAGAIVAGEIMMLRGVQRGSGRAIVVTAHPKARASELSSRYASIGLRAVSFSTSVSMSPEGAAEAREYHVGVVTPEGLEALYAKDPYALKTAVLLLVEDAEILGDARRGRALEAVLSHIHMGYRAPRIVLIGSGLRHAHPLRDWLRAPIVAVDDVPARVRLGVVHRGTSRYCELPSGNGGTEELASPSGKNDDDVRARLIAQLAQLPGRRVLAVRPDGRRALAEAERCAALLPQTSDEEVVAEFDELPMTAATDELRRWLARRLGVLHGDLLPEQRAFLVENFARGRLCALVATATVPELRSIRATDVVVDPRKHVGRRGSHPTLDPMTRRDVEAFAQCAAVDATSAGEVSVARILLPTESLISAEMMRRRYLKLPAESLAPGLLHGRLTEVALMLVATGWCGARREVAAVLRASFSAQVFPDLARGEALEDRMDEALSILRRSGCLSGSELRRLHVTDLGRAALRHRLDVESVEALASWARAAQPGSVAPVEALLVSHLCPAAAQTFIALHADERRTVDHRADLARRARASAVEGRPTLARFLGAVRPLEHSEAVVAKKVLVLLDWLDGVDLQRIERTRRIGAGSIVRLARATAWLLGAMSDVASTVGWSERRCDELRALARRFRERPAIAAEPSARDTERGPATLRSGPVDPSAAAAADVAASDPPLLAVDLVAWRVHYRGHEVPTRPPHHLQRQALVALAALVGTSGRVTMEEVGLRMQRLGAPSERPGTPPARVLRYRIQRALRAALTGKVASDEISRIVETDDGGLRLGHGIVARLVAEPHPGPARAPEPVADAIPRPHAA
jgi:replicative superfamily II helicase